MEVGNGVGALAKSVASCFTDCVCSFALLSALGVSASGLIRWMDGPDFRVEKSGKAGEEDGAGGWESEQWASLAISLSRNLNVASLMDSALIRL